MTAGFGPGMPGFVLLDHFSSIVEGAFGEICYLVGSATTSKQWRDIDVRLILPDEEFVRIFGPFDRPVSDHRLNQRWALLCGALSLYAQRMTGLPVDFQIQPRTKANEDNGIRIGLGLNVRPQPWERE